MAQRIAISYTKLRSAHAANQKSPSGCGRGFFFIPKYRLRIQPIDHPREWDCLPQMLDPADPRRRPLDPQPEPRMRHTAEPPQIEVPLIRRRVDPEILNPLHD